MSIREKNRKLLERYMSFLEGAKALYFVNLTGIDSNDVVDLKKRLKAEDANFSMVKNTVFGIAYDEVVGEDNLDELIGQYGVVVVRDEVVSPAKLLQEFGKKYESVEAAFGILEGEKVSGKKIWQLADLPSKEQLRGQVASTIIAPLRDFVSVANGPLRDFVGVLNAIKEEKE
jgi:large subunit ribosomal protein L10